MKLLFYITYLSLLTAPAWAQSATVFGNSDAHECYMATKFGGGGLDYCERALRHGNLTKRDRAATYVNRGINLTHMGQHTQALDDYQSALNINPKLAEAFLNRGNTYVYLQQFSSAISDYDMAIDLETRDLHAAYFNLGLAYEGLRNLDSAYGYYKKALEVKPEWDLALERVQKYDRLNYKTVQ